ncbi:MAG: hypothetical protein GX552_16815, partial [Chloroflexi bacterium]|nr:hypothetical protein [Chloroflexota bacterium]
STRLTTVRSALHFMLETLKRQRALHGRELITLWSVFDDVVNYEEDPSGTTRAVASLRTKWPDAWRAYEQARHQIDAAPRGHLKVFGTRCDKIVRTLFLYHMAQLRPDGLTAEELMNHVMEWKDHERGQQADQQDNLDHYKVLIDRVEVELVQIKKEGDRFRFQVDQGGVLPHELYRKARADVEGDERERKQAWEALLSLDGWQAQTGLMRLDLGHGVRSIFREIAPESQTNITVNWHGRLIEGRVLMRNLLHLGQHGGSLLDINSAETGQDFYVYISSTPAGDAVDNLIRAGRDPRLLFWTPDDLTAKEQNLLADFAAYRALVRDYAGKETQDAQTVLSWVQDQLRGQMGVIYSIVTDSYSRGRLAALDHQKIPVNCQGELAAILTPPVSQVLDSVYISRELEFTAPAPLDDTNVINVINGIVKVGQIERGARPNRDISAARNYGVALQIMRAGNEHKLDISQCRYTRDMLEWIESKLLDPTESMAVESLYKNFQGIHGPNDIHYGLSKRLVQLYLLCLVRDGKLRVHMTGRNTPVEYIDYTNLAEIEFRTNVLDAMARLQRIRPPEGWNLLAPYAAALLNDPALRSVEQDADIQNAVGTVLAYRQEQKQPFQRFRDRFQELFDELDLPNPLADRLQQWETFLTARVDVSEAVSDLLRALDRAFGYAVWAEQRTEQEEVDDLAVRRAEVAKAQGFFEQRDRLLDAARYARHDLPDWPELDTARRALARTRDQLGNLAYYIDNATPFLTDLLEPAEEAIRSYTTRYLQAYGTVVARIEEARQYIERLPQSAPFRALERLADVRPLGQDPRPALRNTCRAALEGLPSTRATRETLSQELRHWPQPPSCAFTLGDHQTWVEQAEAAVQRCDAALREALLNKAALLHSEALRARLQQGAEEPFLADLLAARTPQEVADTLIATLGGEAADAAGAVALLQRYLLEIKVVRVRLADFRPSRQTIEREDLDAVTAEFRAFLQQALRGATDDDQQLPIIELE